MNKELNISNLITYINLIHALIKKAKYDIANATIEVSDINVALTFAFGFFGIKKNKGSDSRTRPKLRPLMRIYLQ